MGTGEPTSRLAALADGVRVLEKTLDDERRSRDAAIFAAWQDRGGRDFREIAREAGMSPSHIQRIIDAQTAAAQQAVA